MSAIIEVTDLVKKYGDLEAVKGISFEVELGEIFGFLGPNGAGKTTTISILCTLLSPTHGTAKLDGWDVTAERDRVRESIGLVFQDPSLDERLTARENLEFHAYAYRVPREERDKRIQEVLGMVELLDRQEDRVETFSGGMKRRLEIARGLLHYPKVLFLDEPTIGLDPQTRNSIWEYIRELKEKHSITIFLTTHYMDEAENCDRIAIIDYGRIIALDTPEALKSQVGGDIIKISTANNEEAEQVLLKDFEVTMIQERDCLCFEVPDAANFIPSFIKAFPVAINSISMHRPTLDDVFLKLTGREIRDEEAGGIDKMRAFARAWRPTGRR
ncbi:MAG: ABC transporter ATP-binding protein [Actinobacteria bacterium RBG_19FT_COMBO_54_7]|uniref:ABC transporter ATP-binding protein n=1 Tax=Candidatus Solincola sediminis TaxID=1797199 RepID=A0A1F2WQA6_9ACTN|nr:MAG: ABC transporter ATP-binding protein [Candidatus Solincola sediminis]OFW61467.1 MAG: ABC transporter ATP-binding protein [Candidatus Solincola sediminis]OFW68383.1 MAG: ABC transporter ATP-binding protein [Actinobacteria bacterium RBG_19FT_COMBO_54_7]